jgi:hypothetical protein
MGATGWTKVCGKNQSFSFLALPKGGTPSGSLPFHVSLLDSAPQADSTSAIAEYYTF